MSYISRNDIDKQKSRKRKGEREGKKCVERDRSGKREERET